MFLIFRFCIFAFELERCSPQDGQQITDRVVLVDLTFIPKIGWLGDLTSLNLIMQNKFDPVCFAFELKRCLVFTSQ